MYARILGIEIFTEIIPVTKKFLDWDFSIGENHVWFGRLHIVWNPIGEKHEPTEGVEEVA